MMIKRVFDVFFSAIFTVLISPLWLIQLLLTQSSRSFVKGTQKIGLHGERFELYIFRRPRKKWLKRSLTLLNILKGEMSFVGPRPITPCEFLQSEIPYSDLRLAVRPGLYNPWKVKKLAGIDYQSEFDVDRNYAQSYSILKDLSIFIKSLFASLGASQTNQYLNNFTLFGLKIDNISMNQAIDRILEMLSSEKKQTVSFINADYANISTKNDHFKEALKASNLLLPDGLGIKIASKWLHSPIKQNVNGTDLFPLLCKEIEKTSHSVYLLGSKPGVTDRLVMWVHSNHPKTKIAGHHHGYFSEAENEAIISAINNANPDLLLVALGAPKQDIWVQENLKRLNSKVIMTLGGCFDFYAGEVKRAPVWVREIGMEWIYRLLQEPKRLWRRYLVGNVTFLFRAYKYKLQIRNQDNNPIELSKERLNA